MAKLYVTVEIKAIKDGRVYYQMVGEHTHIEEGAEFNAFREALVNAGLDLARNSTAIKSEAAKSISK